MLRALHRLFLTLSVLAVAAPPLVLPAAAQSSTPQDAATRNAGQLSAVIELFTSQGCSSCPPADRLLASSLARKPDVIALTLAVDYWDYLGWKDTFGSAKNSQRQRAYAATRGDGLVYTPQVVVNGQVHANGANPIAVKAAIDQTVADFQARAVPVRGWSEGSNLVIEAGAANNPSAGVGEATIWLAVVQKEGHASPGRGENRGHDLVYVNIVRELTPVGMWNGAPKTIKIARNSVMTKDTENCVIILQSGTTGPILGAAWLKPKP